MERRYYLRGLGVGIAVTAVIMGVMTSRDAKMTDREVIARAKELGMVENTVLSDMNEEAEQGQEPADISSGQKMEPEQAGNGIESSSDGMGDGASEGITAKDTETEDPEENAGKSDDAAGSQSGAERPEGAGNTQPEPEEAVGSDRPQAGQQGSMDNKNDEDTESPEPANGRESTSPAEIKSITVSPGDGSHTVARKLADAGIVSSADAYDEFLCQNGYDKKLRTGTFSIPADASDEQIARIVTGAE